MDKLKETNVSKYLPGSDELVEDKMRGTTKAQLWEIKKGGRVTKVSDDGTHIWIEWPNWKDDDETSDNGTPG